VCQPDMPARPLQNRRQCQGRQSLLAHILNQENINGRSGRPGTGHSRDL